MNPNREELLFQLALLKPAAERTAFLDRECGEDAALRARLDALLTAHEESEGILAESAPAARGTMKIEFADIPDETIGQKIGRYKILEKIGEGGCGVVYVAEQTEPVRRRVALKVIKLGMDTKAVVARFEAERQALAMMDHPNIAKVLDAGTTDTGRPYFIMELVRGIRITDYCDQEKVPTRERLELFIQICQAIQHAHQKGIIHRDIKPSNILVTLHDGVPVPKVIDFGIAKATTDQRLTDKTVYTQLQQFIGTPAYMSPEQAEMSGLDIDTRSDIYSLGVLLYELLTGKTPFDAQELMSQGIDEMRKTIREKDPVRPSTKLATLKGDELTTTARRRSVDRSKLLHQLKGDLDWIVMKCLEKDRKRRYETANGLAMDLKRHLNNDTVVARPPSSAYRFQKLVRRNKLAVGASSAVFMALCLGIIAATWQAVRATQAREAALAAQASEKVQRQQAVVNEQKAVAAEKEQARLRTAAEQEAARSKKIAQASLDVADNNFRDAEQILDGMPSQPEMVGLFAEMGREYAYFGRWQLALTNYSKVGQIEPSDPPLWQLALLSYQVGDIEGYNHWRDEILRHCGTTTNGDDAAYYAQICLIAPPSATESKTIGGMVNVGVTSSLSPGSRYQSEITKECWDYRQGHFANARDWLQKASEFPDASDWYWDGHVQNLMLVAMAEYQLKQTNDARATFARGLQLADEKMIKPGNHLGNDWDGWLVAHFLMREAVAMMPEVIASNIVFAGIVAEKPAWQIALDQAGLKYSSVLHFDGTWALNLNGQPISDLSLLRAAPVSELRLEHTAVTNLATLHGMPLKELHLVGDNVSDLSPLAGMALARLIISGTPVRDLSPLQGMPLTDLRMSGCTNITDLSPLAGMTTLQVLELPRTATNIEVLRGLTHLTRIDFKSDPKVKSPNKTAAQFWADYERNEIETRDLPTILIGMGVKLNSKTINGEELNLDYQPVADLSPLRGMALTKLQLERTKVTDLTPLQGMPLQSLSITGTQVADILPLHGMPIRNLRMTECTNITDLSPLAGMVTLQTVILPPNATNVDVLRSLTKLTRIGFKYDSSVHGPDKTAAQFWADYDKNQLVSQSAK